MICLEVKNKMFKVGLCEKDLEELLGRKPSRGDILPADDLMVYDQWNRVYVRRGKYINSYDPSYDLAIDTDKKAVWPTHDFAWSDVDIDSQEYREVNYFLDRAKERSEARELE